MINFFLDIIHHHKCFYKTLRFGDWYSPTQLGPIDRDIYWAQLSRAVPEDGDRFQSPKRSVL
jgi:hypothetical protein